MNEARIAPGLAEMAALGGDTSGFALLSAVTLMALVAGFGIIVTHYVLSTRAASKYLETQVYATQTAEAGLFKALYCLNPTDDAKCGGVAGPDYTGESNISVDDGRFTSVVSGTGGGVFYAVNGVVRVRNNASATAVAGSKVFVDQNGIVVRSSELPDLSDIRLSALPPGVWRVTQTTWRETSQ